MSRSAACRSLGQHQRRFPVTLPSSVKHTRGSFRLFARGTAYGVLILLSLLLGRQEGLHAQGMNTPQPMGSGPERIKCGTWAGAPPAAWGPKGRAPQFVKPSGFRDSIRSASGLFLIHFNATASDPDSVTPLAFAERAAAYADSAYELEVTELGYAAPAFSTELSTTTGHYDLYIAPVHLDQQNAYYGATYWLTDGALASSPSGVSRTRSYTIVDNAFTDPIYATHGYDALRITIFHEFFHVIQFAGYGKPPTYGPNYTFFQEMSSTWMEWRSTPDVKDYLNYVSSYLHTLDTRFDLSPSGGYGQYLFFAYLATRYGDDIIRQTWELYRDHSSDPIECIERALRLHGSSWLAEYTRFGAELVRTGYRFRGASHLPDAPLLPVDTLRMIRVPAGEEHSFVTVATSLQFAESGSGNDTCFAVIARDTERSLQSEASITFAVGGADSIHYDQPGAYEDTTFCGELPSFGCEAIPSPFILADGTQDLLQIIDPNGSGAASVIANIFSLAGRRVFSHEFKSHGSSWPGFVTWDGRDPLGKLVESGEYLYALRVDGALKVGKFVVVRKP